MVVLPPFSCVGDVVQVSAVTVARTLSTRPEATPPGPLPPHLEEIVAGSHSSLGADGCAALTDILHKYSHIFPAPGDPVTSRTQVVRHEIETNGAPLGPTCGGDVSNHVCFCPGCAGRGRVCYGFSRGLP